MTNERVKRNLKDGSEEIMNMLSREAAKTNLSISSLNSSQSSEKEQLTLKELAAKDPKKALS